MTSSAEARRRLAGMVVLMCAAPVAGADGPPAFAPRVTHEIAARWSVDERAVVLDWSRAGDTVTLPATSLTRLDGAARDGWITLLVTAAGGAARAIPVRAGVRCTVAVATHDLAAGTRLQTADLGSAPITRWGVPSRDTDETAAPGWEVRRPMAAGEPLLRPAVAPPPLVSAGGPVSLEWVHDGVRVTLSGVALHAARAHEIVRVRLDNGRAVRTAWVTGPGAAVLTEVTR